MPACEITIINKLGLHARAAAKFVGIASKFNSTIRIGRSAESQVDGKSIMAVMMLAAGKGTTVHLLLPLTDPADPAAPAHPPEPGA